MSLFADLVVDPYAERVYTAELTVYDKVNSEEKTLYFVAGRNGFISKPADTPSNTFFEPRLQIPLIFTQSLYSDGKFGGSSIPGYGSLVLVNSDGNLDAFSDYAVDGRRLVLKLGGMGFSYSEFGTVFDGTMSSVEFDDDFLTVRVRDLQHMFTPPLQKTLYAGTGSWEGNSDLEGRVKPHCWGRVRNAEPILVDSSNLRYQVHYRSIELIDAVRDKGVELTNFGDYASLTLLDAASIPAGNFATCLSAGCFKLGSSPVGTVTCDVYGDNVPTASNSSSILMGRIAKDIAGISSVDSTSISALDSLNPNDVGIYFSEQVSISEALDELANSIGAFYTFDRGGRFTVGRIDAPSGYVEFFSGDEILSFTRKPTVIPNWRIKLGYAPNRKNLSQSEIATQFLPGGASSSLNSSLTDEYRYVYSQDASVKTEHLLAEDQEILTSLDSASAAQEEADRLLDMFKVARDVYSVKVKTQPLRNKLGDVVGVSYDRYGLSLGKLFVIVSLTEDYVTSTVEMELWG